MTASAPGGARQQGRPRNRKKPDNMQEQLFATPQIGTTSDDYYTPQWLFDLLGLTFDLDVSSPPGGPLFTPCHAYYTQADDGLAQPWNGTVFMNPPYSQPAPWVDKYLEHSNGIALLPFAKSKWCQKLWDSDAAMVYVRAVTFVRNDTSVINQAPFSLGLWAMNDHCIAAISNVGKVR